MTTLEIIHDNRFTPNQKWFQARKPSLQQSRITGATMRGGMANIVYNMRRFLFLERISPAVW